MSDWEYIYGEIDEKINANGIKAISGDVLNEVLTKMIGAVNGNLPEAGTEYTAGTNITITDGEIDTKRVLELTDITIADGASAIKIITTAGGKPAVAEGGGTQATGAYSHAEGGGTQATGACSHAEGSGTIASGDNSHAEGGGTKAIGVQSHAEGGGSVASGDNSHAEGQSTIASGANQHVSGKYNVEDITGTYAVIVGNGTTTTNRSNARTLDWYGNEVLAGTITANGVNLNEEINLKEPLLPATPENPETKFLNGNREWVEASGTEYTAGTNITITDGEIDTKRVLELTDITIADGASAIKIITTAGGKPAVAEGLSTIASGDYSHAEGGGTQATGAYSHAEGGGTQATGACSHAEGSGTIASGDNSHAEGGGTKAIGVQSHAEGGGSVASGDNSHAEGQSTIASGENQHVSGKYNVEDSTGDKVFIVGNGTSETRHNAFSVNADNSITIGDTTITEAQLIALLATL